MSGGSSYGNLASTCIEIHFSSADMSELMPTFRSKLRYHDLPLVPSMFVFLLNRNTRNAA